MNELNGELHNISLSQVGTLPFHCPSAWHVLSAGPFSVYPVSHEYLATSPKEVPALVFTRPLVGLSSWPQESPADKSEFRANMTNETKR